jgi:hypothetical protein
MKMTSYEEKCNYLLEETTGYYLRKGRDEDGTYYQMYDLHGDKDGDPWYDWDDLQDYLCNNDEYLQGLTNMQCWQPS